ncbi:uncharacterized protein MELLADRAFT_67766 [Melampsora larici-populina 98AG31]|uniref:DUF6589 domain-containing protein n=1 Tax=Melampsora larici-populina (strain 98AG31 / pathotype 3-4-7) TaxID=747676 RepID=F4S476_MELLP|nr:uncharacterized protein MELLADRAFT_67766 [Melampsora larici-populina 98AG31]EGG00555.1 hypothetical protein MELLADRAFT_67766 [Melampsora larici-populina 98AG31]
MASQAPGLSPVPLVAIQRILENIKSNFLTPKSFLEAYLLSKAKDLVIVRAQNAWSSTNNLESSGRVLDAIRANIVKTKDGRVYWNQYILSQAVMLVQNQHPPSGKVPNGFYIATSEVTPSMFDHQVLNKQNDAIESSMPFLFNLIKSAFDYSHLIRLRDNKIRDERRERKKSSGKTHLPAVLPLEHIISPRTTSSSSMIDSYNTSPNLQLGLKAIRHKDSMIIDESECSPTLPSALNQNNRLELNIDDSTEGSPNTQHSGQQNLELDRDIIDSSQELSNSQSTLNSATNQNINLELDSDSDKAVDPDPLGVSDVGVTGALREDDQYVENWEGYVYRKSKDHSENVNTRHKSVARTICNVVANICNRRVNALQVENGLTMLACGVSERVNAYLNYIGLAVNRKTAIRALRHIGEELRKNIIAFMGEETWLAPFITLDNIDFQEHIHTTSVEKESTMWHGSWGYIHRPKIPEGISISPEAFTSEKLKAILNNASQNEINLSNILPSPTEVQDWELTLKSQIAQVMVRYIAEPIDTSKIPYRHPPPVQELPAEKPDIMMLKMMSASDNSTAGVGELYNAVLQQTGLSREKFSSCAQVWEGDLGTARIVLSVVEERDPCSSPPESFQHILMILGAAHVLWNISQAILLGHWGTHLDQKDMGAWRGIEALGGRYDKPTSKKDFTAMIKSMERLHEGSITLCIQRVMQLDVETVGKDRVKLTADKMKTGTGTSIKRLQDLYSINVPLLQEFLHRLKGRSGLNDVYQSHHNLINHSSMRTFLRMAHQHDLAKCTPASTLPKGRPADTYAGGLKKLRAFAREGKLAKFHWPTAGGSHPQEDEVVDSSGNESNSD